MKTVLITGGTGLVGKALTRQLTEKGYRVIVLTRNVKNKAGTGQVSYAAWDVEKQYIDIPAVQQADFIIHLAGAGVVDKRWTKAYKNKIISSRTESSKLIIDTLKANQHQVKAIISASATGWYGPDKNKDHFFVETDPPANDFLARTCVAWEQSIDAASALPVRICKLRTGIVLSGEGGALVEFKKPVRLGIAAILGNGRQVVSWIHIEDLCRIYIYAMENEKLHGSYNAVAPAPVTNKKLVLELAEMMKGKYFIPVHVPPFILKIMMGESSVEVLKSTTVSSERIKAAGFTFLYPSLESAIDTLAK